MEQERFRSVGLPKDQKVVNSAGRYCKYFLIEIIPVNTVFLMSLREFAGNFYLHLQPEVHDGFHEDLEHIAKEEVFSSFNLNQECVLNQIHTIKFPDLKYFTNFSLTSKALYTVF